MAAYSAISGADPRYHPHYYANSDSSSGSSSKRYNNDNTNDSGSDSKSGAKRGREALARPMNKKPNYIASKYKFDGNPVAWLMGMKKIDGQRLSLIHI